MIGKTIIIGYLCLCVAAWAINYMATANTPIVTQSQQLEFDPNNITTWFAITQFDVSTAIALTIGGIAGLIGLIFKVGITGAGAILFYILAVVFTPTNDLILGLPKVMGALLTPYNLSWLAVIPQAFLLLGIFFWFAEILSQRSFEQ